jgi:hypothetical protein
MYGIFVLKFDRKIYEELKEIVTQMNRFDRCSMIVDPTSTNPGA